MTTHKYIDALKAICRSVVDIVLRMVADTDNITNLLSFSVSPISYADIAYKDANCVAAL